jgi:uncharacterized protein with PQ loop repeat
MTAVVVAAFTAVAVTANVAFVWPQALRMLRTRRVAGVSPGTWTIQVVVFSVWTAFSLRTGFWALFAANVAALLIMTTGTVHGWKRQWAAIASAGGALAVLGAVFAAKVPPRQGSVGVRPRSAVLRLAARPRFTTHGCVRLCCRRAGSRPQVQLTYRCRRKCSRGARSPFSGGCSAGPCTDAEHNHVYCRKTDTSLRVKSPPRRAVTG